MPNAQDEDRSLRSRAQEELAQASHNRGKINSLTRDEMEAVVEELRVHQVELQIQQEDLRDANQQLSRSRDRYERLFIFAPSGYVAIGRNRHIVTANKAAANLLQASPDDLIDRKITDFIDSASQDTFYKLLRRLLKGETAAPLECQIVTESGHVRQVLVNGMLLDEQDQTRYLLAFTDITAQKMAQGELAAANKVLREFVDNISHELRTPLANIRIYLQLLAENPAELERYMATLGREMERLEYLVQDLLLLSIMDRPNPPLKRVSFDLTERITTLISDRRPLIPQTLTLDAEPARIRADVTMIDRVISILLGNAALYTPDDGHIKVEVRQLGSMVRLRITDTGPGIPLAERLHVFKRFFRGQAAQDKPGTGLGLSIARQIIEAEGGRIGFEFPAEGTCVFVWLPAEGEI